MSISKQTVTLCIVSSLVAVVGSCIETKNPLSDEKTSKIDEHLIGDWKLLDDDSIWKVGKSKDVKNALAVATPDDTAPIQVFATTIKSRHYLSASAQDANAKAKPGTDWYEIYQYEFIDKDTVVIRPMDSDVVEKAIVAKQLRGKIDRDEPVITDTPEGIAKYIEAHADACFPKAEHDDEALIFKRAK